MQVHEYIKHFEEDEKHFYIWDKIIFSNTIKDRETLRKIKKYKPLVTYDNLDELKKIKDHCSTAGLVLRLKVPDTGSQVEMSSKFGAEPAEAYELLHHAAELGLDIEGLSFHVGSQCTNFDNYTRALELTSELLHEARAKGHTVKLIDIGGGFPVPYDAQVPRFEKLADVLNTDFKRLFPDDIEILAEPGRFMVATAAMLVTDHRQGRRDGKFLPYKRWRLSYLFRSGVRPLDPELPGLPRRSRGTLRGGGPHLRQLRQDHAVRPASPKSRNW